MKLLTKTNRYYLLSSSLVFLAGGLIFYGMIQAIIREEVSEVLEFELASRIEALSQQSNPPEEVSGIEFEMQRVSRLQDSKTYRDTLLLDEQQGERIPYRQLTLYQRIQGQPYRLILRESLIEAEDLLFAVSVSLASLFGLMILVLWFVNSVQARKLWAGFYENIRLLRGYDLANVAPVPAINSDIDEFQEMNAAIRKMTDKIREDYFHLKEFTENASHEMQTPLTIIRSHIDLLIQSELSQEQHTLIARISQATYRMSSTHRALLLLSKIENKQFKEITPVNLTALIQAKLEELDDFVADKQLNVTVNADIQTVILPMNPQLAEILISNLLTNAIKHNEPKGFIDIHLTAKSIKVSNSGPALRTEPEKLFQRFRKDNPTTESAGLGMAIMKVIADLYSLKLIYDYQNQHTLTLWFDE